LSPEQKAKYDEGKKIATTKALEEIEKTPAMRKKPHQKRGIQV
jgi:protein-disulfide isomerase-like protein with CxxC motif